MSPSLRLAAASVILPPRLGTSCHIRWLLFDMSMGLTRKNVAMYSTLPFAFVGASSMSLMIVLCESCGSSSPYTRPAIVSYCPAVPNDAPPNAGEILVSITSRVTRAADSGAHASATAPATAPTSKGLRNIPSLSIVPSYGYTLPPCISQTSALVHTKRKTVGLVLHVFVCRLTPAKRRCQCVPPKRHSGLTSPTNDPILFVYKTTSACMPESAAVRIVSQTARCLRSAFGKGRGRRWQGRLKPR
jgi:hypothetical protein